MKHHFGAVALLSAYIGDAQDKDAMQTVIIPEKGLTNGDYQLLADTFSVAQSGVYALGIRGMIDDNPRYMSLDNITLGEYITHTVRTTDSEYSTITLDKTEAYAGDTVRATATVSEGYFLDSLHADPSVVWLDDTRFIMPDADVVLTACIHKTQTGVLHIINNTMFVYPNPANDYTFVEGATDDIRVYDLMGRLVLTQTAETGKTMLNITTLSAGVYTVQSAGQTASLIVK